MSSASLPKEEAQALNPDATAPSQPAVSYTPPTSCLTSTTTSPAVALPVGGPSRDSVTPAASTLSSDGGSLAATAVPASPAPNPPTPRAPGGSIDEQDPLRPKFVSSAGYVVPAPSYSIFPRMNSSPGNMQQSAAAPALKLHPPMPAAALQPPVPGQLFRSRPSFSYNIASHANTSSASGQQLRPAISANQIPMQGSKVIPPTTTASLQPPAPGQPMRPNMVVPGTIAQNIPRPMQLPISIPKGQVSTSSNFSFGANAQLNTSDSSDRKPTSKDGASISVTPGAGSSAASISSEPIKGSTTVLSSSSADSNASSSSSMLVSTTQSFMPRPGMPITPGTTGLPMMPTPLAAKLITADSSPSSLRPMVPSSTVHSNFDSGPIPPQNVQQQTYLPYHSRPAIAGPPQAPWLHPPFAGGLQHTPFLPYPAVLPSPFPMQVQQGMPHPSVPSPNIQHLANPTAVPGGASTITEPESAKILREASLPPAVDNDKQVNDLSNDGGTTKSADEDAWTSHKTETGVIYYYNSITGESTYDKPSSFKGEPEKTTDHPTPVTWEKVAGTNWMLITTNDAKKYYYDTKNKVSSWQVPAEVAEVRKNEECDSQVENAAVVPEKASPPINIGTPAVQTGGRDSVVLRSSTGQISSSALDLIKKKLQDAGAPGTSTPLPLSSVPPADLNGSRAVEAEAKGHQSISNKDKVKDADGEGNVSDSSSDSEDAESGPTKEECIIQFKEMLKERGVAPFSKWEKELPKIVFDPRFKAVPSYSTRRSIFEHFVRTRAEEERKEKRAAQKAAIDGFKELLEEASEEIDHKTDYQTFKRKWGKDPRFEALDRKERELLLNEKVLPLKKAAEEKTQAIHTAAVSSFMSMLRENKDITMSSRWSKVKDSLRNDPRYKSVKHEEREVLFNEYMAELKAAEDEAEQASKAKRDEHDKLKEREREMRKRKEREEQEMERVRLKVRRKEAVSSYQALLVETIKDPKASWTESKPKLEKDPQGRATNSDLSEADAEKLFRDHVKDLFERCARDYRSLLAEVITAEAACKTADDEKSVLNSWSEAKRLLKADPRYTKMPRKERESLWIRHADDLIRKQKAAAAADSKERPDKERRDKTSLADLSRRSPRRSHGRR